MHDVYNTILLGSMVQSILFNFIIWWVWGWLFIHKGAATGSPRHGLPPTPGGPPTAGEGELCSYLML